MTRIDPRIHQALDGELAREALPPALRPALERLEAAAALLRAPPSPPVPRRSVAAWVLAEIRRPRPGPMARLARWLTERHAITVSLRPTWSVAVAVLVAAAALVPTHGIEGPILSAEEGVAQFVARFPGARSVEVVGSFTDWRSGAIPLQDDDHDGVWQTEVVLPAGEHEYMFVVDGERWVADPLAGRYVDDGFGRQNAILFVRPAAR